MRAALRGERVGAGLAPESRGRATAGCGVAQGYLTLAKQMEATANQQQCSRTST